MVLYHARNSVCKQTTATPNYSNHVFYARLFPYHMYKESVSAEKELKKSRETGGGAVFGTFQTESEVSDQLSA